MFRRMVIGAGVGLALGLAIALVFWLIDQSLGNVSPLDRWHNLRVLLSFSLGVAVPVGCIAGLMWRQGENRTLLSWMKNIALGGITGVFVAGLFGWPLSKQHWMLLLPLAGMVAAAVLTACNRVVNRRAAQ